MCIDSDVKAINAYNKTASESKTALTKLLEVIDVIK